MQIRLTQSHDDGPMSPDDAVSATIFPGRYICYNRDTRKESGPVTMFEMLKALHDD